MGLGRAEISFTSLEAEKIPEATLPRVVVLGRSNVGKSSFLNALIHPFSIFRTGKTPGVTRGVVAARVQVTAKTTIELVDLPGFSYAKISKSEIEQWENLCEAMKERRGEAPLLWIWLADPARDPEELESIVSRWLGGELFFFVFTKADRIKSSQRAATEKKWQKVNQMHMEKIFWTSAQKGDGMQDIAKFIMKNLK